MRFLRSNRIIIVIILCINPFTLLSQQKKTYHSQLLNADINLLVYTDIKVLNLNDGSKGEIFIVLTPDKQFEYMITLVKKNEKLNFHKIKEREEFKEAYLKECNCIIESESLLQYNSFLSFQLKTISNIKMQKLYGYVDSFVMNESMYSVIYLAPDANKFEKFKSEYKSFLRQIDK